MANETLRARRIVKIENRRLRENVRRAAARRMQRIPIDLGWSSVVSSDDQRDRAGSSWHCGGVKKRFAGDRPLRALGKRNQVHFGPATTR